eukprot:Hpha_TRINITY_DN7744_c0_g1::TRINITY_DN7744_c0_g1_i2::g.85540::m.85540
MNILGSDSVDGATGGFATSMRMGYSWPQWGIQIGWTQLSSIIRPTFKVGGVSAEADLGVKIAFTNAKKLYEPYIIEVIPGGPLDTFAGGKWTKNIVGGRISKATSPPGNPGKVTYSFNAKGDPLDVAYPKMQVGGDAQWEIFMPTIYDDPYTGDVSDTERVENGRPREEHVAWVYDKPTQRLTFYRNGEVFDHLDGMNAYKSDVQFTLGQQKKGDFWFGEIRDMRIYGGYAMSDEDAKSMATRPAPKETGVKLQLRLDSDFLLNKPFRWASEVPEECCGCSSCLKYYSANAHCVAQRRGYNPIYDSTCGRSQDCGACGVIKVTVPPAGAAPKASRGCLPTDTPVPPPPTPQPTADTESCADLQLTGFTFKTMGAAGPVDTGCDGDYEPAGDAAGHWVQLPDKTRELWRLTDSTYRCVLSGVGPDGASLGGRDADEAPPSWWATVLNCRAKATP